MSYHTRATVCVEVLEQHDAQRADLCADKGQHMLYTALTRVTAHTIHCADKSHYCTCYTLLR